MGERRYPGGSFSLGGHSRNAEGVIATFDNGDVRHFTQAGYMRAVVEYADANATLVVTLSTPETIFRDLQGTRAHIEPRFDTKQPPDAVAVPEPSLLGRVGRRDLLRGWEAKRKHG